MPRYCVNEACNHYKNHDEAKVCEYCNTPLCFMNRYFLSAPIRVNQHAYSEIWQVEDWGDFIEGEEAQSDDPEFLHAPKIIKILTPPHQKEKEILDREYRILSYINKQYPSLLVPKVSRHFSQSLMTVGNSFGLVMTKIEGESLENLINQQTKFDEKVAIIWLKQILIALNQVHQLGILHLDIQPSNLILSPSNKIYLIDFGFATREQIPVAQGTLGYSAPELSKSCCSQASDYYSLGQTFWTLFTGKIPTREAQASSLQSWQQYAPHVSQPLIRLIKDMVKRPPAYPNCISSALSERLERIQNPHCYWKNLLKTILSIAVISTLGVMGLRVAGILQAMELKLLDIFLTTRTTEMPDSRLLVVTARKRDSLKTGPTLSDQKLSQIIAKLEEAEPATIGLDIYRDFPVSQNALKLKSQLANDNLFGVCNIASPDIGDDKGYARPPEIPSDRLGFADTLVDRGNFIRRHLLTISDDHVNFTDCPTTIDFAFLVSLHYLATVHRLQLEDANQSSVLRIADTEFQPLYPGNASRLWLDRYAGPYQRTDLKGYQILLNYRSVSSLDAIATEVTVEQLLSDQVDPDQIKNKIVLIGVLGNRASSEDWWPDPTHWNSDNKVPGVWIQAHKISQILSAVLDQRSLLWVLPRWGEILWIISGAALGAIMVLQLMRWSRLWILGLSVIVLVFSQGIVAYFILWNGGWLPWFPSACSGVIAVVVSKGWLWITNNRNKNLKVFNIT